MENKIKVHDNPESIIKMFDLSSYNHEGKRAFEGIIRCKWQMTNGDNAAKTNACLDWCLEHFSKEIESYERGKSGV